MKKNKGSHLTDSDIAIVPREPEFPAETSAVETVSAQTESNNAVGTTVATDFTFGDGSPSSRNGRKSSLSYPIGQLPDDETRYFDVTVNTSNGKEVNAKLASIRAFAYRNNYAVTMRTVDGAIRVWRKAEKTVRNHKTSN